MLVNNLFPPKYFAQVFVVKAVIQHAGKYLLVREPTTASWKPGKLGLPGGKLDPGEDWLNALHRELKEELNIKVIPQGIFSIEEIVYHNPKIDQLQLTHHVIIQCAVEQSDLKNLKAEGEAEWKTLSELQAFHINDMTEFYLPALWQQLEKSPQTLAPLELMRVWQNLDSDAYKEWYKIT